MVIHILIPVDVKKLEKHFIIDNSTLHEENRKYKPPHVQFGSP